VFFVDGLPPPDRRGGDDARLTLRVDRVWDSSRLHDLAALNERRLPGCSFVVAELDGIVVAAVPLDGGPALADPFVRTAHLLPLLELRAAQIRRVDLRRRPRLFPRRATFG
jgi:hypothetical protein